MTNWFKTLFAPLPTPAKGDPFAHPDIARMSSKELADLPLTPPPSPARERVGNRVTLGACRTV